MAGSRKEKKPERASESKHAPSEANAFSPASSEELSGASDAAGVRRCWSHAAGRVVLPSAGKHFVGRGGKVEVQPIVSLAMLLPSLAGVCGEAASPAERAQCAVSVAASELWFADWRNDG